MTTIAFDTTNTTTTLPPISGEEILNEIINFKENGNKEYKAMLKNIKKLDEIIKQPGDNSGENILNDIKLKIEKHQKKFE